MARHITLLGKDPHFLNNNSPKQSLFGLAGAVKIVRTEAIKTAEPFISLFAINEEILSSITESMKEKGYDDAMPLIIWKEKDILIDGHTRLQAAKSAGIASVPAVYASFENEDAVLDYMHRVQFGRRNITDADLIKLIMNALPQYEKKYGDGSKAEFLSKRFIGLSVAKAKQAIVVVEKASEADIERIRNGEMAIYHVYDRLRLEKKQQKEKEKVTANFSGVFLNRHALNDGVSRFFNNPENTRIVRTDDNGIFYFRKKKKEVKAFRLPKYLNSERIRQRIIEIIEEEYLA